MSDFKILKCPSCGSSNIETQSESILTCSHCGSNFVSKNTSHTQVKPSHSRIKLLFLIAVPLILTIIFVMNLIPDNKEKSQVNLNSVVNSNNNNTNDLIKAPLSSIPILNTKALGITQESLDESKEKAKKPIISIVNQVAGETSIGGKYWIITVRNDSNTPVIRPRVVISLFDKDNRRISEQSGWSKQDTLVENAETTLLVLISEPPTVEFRSEFQAMAAFPGIFESSVIRLNVDDFIVKPDGNSSKNNIIIGDVSNPHEFRIDYIRVQAIARNANGVAVGLADAYVTNSSLAHQEKSGFKIKASTFITEPAASWSLWAAGSKHREK